uniref:Predicted protein n=1 Tax=Hordeum vulgare subsp. vulgare TaxID=112509 RepID=F2E1V3_HORVV|nr:predicted protein [Hordeum vulgare subsp. vulgare]
MQSLEKNSRRGALGHTSKDVRGRHNCIVWWRAPQDRNSRGEPDTAAPCLVRRVTSPSSCYGRQEKESEQWRM